MMSGLCPIALCGKYRSCNVRQLFRKYLMSIIRESRQIINLTGAKTVTRSTKRQSKLASFILNIAPKAASQISHLKQSFCLSIKLISLISVKRDTKTTTFIKVTPPKMSHPGVWTDNVRINIQDHMILDCLAMTDFTPAYLLVPETRLRERTHQNLNQLESTQVMSRSCSDHTQVMIRSCSGHAQVMLRSCSGHAQVMLRSCPGHAQVMLRSCSGHAQVMLRSCSGHAQVMLRSCLGHAHVMLRSCSGHAQVMLRSCSGHV